MAEPLRDPGDPADPTVVVRFDGWRLKGEISRRVALHVHGDEIARAHAPEIAEALSQFQQSGELLTLPELNDAVAAMAASLDLTGYASELKCAPDYLNTALDVSIHSAHEPSTPARDNAFRD